MFIDLDIFFKDEKFQAIEYIDFFEISLCINKTIELDYNYHLTDIIESQVTISTLTVENATNSNIPIPPIPQENLYSPNRASQLQLTIN